MERLPSNRLLSLLYCALACLLCVLFFGEAASQSGYRSRSTRRSDRELRDVVKEKYLNNARRRDIRYVRGNLTIRRNDYSSKHIIVTRGDVRIAGEVDGTIIVLKGDICVTRTGLVGGDVISVDGRVTEERGSRVRGDALELSSWRLIRSSSFSSTRRSNRGRYFTRRSQSSIWNRAWGFYESSSPVTQNNFLITRYNRVEGPFLGARLPRRRSSRPIFNRVNAFGEVGHAFDSNDWQFQAGGFLAVSEDYSLNVGGEYHDFFDTQDRWLLPEAENSMSSFFAKKDFYDYYARKGFSAFAMYDVTRDLHFKVSFKDDEYRTINNTTNFSLFSHGNDFRLNPAIDEGDMQSILVNLSFDTRDDERAPLSGWRVAAQAEVAGREFLGGDFDFERYIVDVRRYQSIGFTESIDLRVRFGTSRGFIPSQFLFDIGGISTLPGRNFKEFTGNRMILFNSEYRNHADALFGNVLFFDLFDVIVFANTGYAWFEDDNGSAINFDNIEFDDLRTDIGFGLAMRNSNIRLDVAKGLGGGGFNVAFRINRHF